MRAVVFSGAGGNEVVRVEQRPDPRAGPREVVVRARFAGMNAADVLQRRGRYPAPPGAPADVPGLEVAGVVAACGEAVTRWQPGDRVFGIVGGGGLADVVVVDERCLARVPDTLDDRDAAAVPEVFVTAHDAVCTQGALGAGEVLVVHGAAGGVGTAAVQVGAARGARVLAVVRSPSVAAAVEALGGEVLSDDDFARGVEEATGGAGADVILELVGAPHFPANLDALAHRGRIVVIGVGAGHQASVPLLALMAKRAVLRGSVLRGRTTEEKGAAVDAFAADVVPLLAEGRIRPVIDSVYPADDAVAAFERLEGRGKVGKVLLDFTTP